MLPMLRSLNRRHKLASICQFLEKYPASSVLLVGVGGEGSPFEQMIERAVAARVDWVLASDVRLVENSPWTFVVADARRLPFRDRAFDLVVANAVIEHVGDEADQARVVHEHQRVGRRWIITTPNRWFPIEAHTGAVLRHFSAGWRRRHGDVFTRLLSRAEFERLLPHGATIRGAWYSPTFMALSERMAGPGHQSSVPLPKAELALRFQRAAAFAGASPIDQLVGAPVRTLTVKGARVVGAQTDRTWSRRARTFWGESMQVVLPEAVSNQLIRFGLTEPGLTAILLRLLQTGDTFVDVGAHFGYFTLLAECLVGHQGEIHAFEPTPSTFQILTANAGSRPNVVLNQVAAWSRPDIVRITDLGPRLSAFNSLFEPRLEWREAQRARGVPVQVEAVSLDDYCIKAGIRPSFVKIDAESAEREILEGMRRLLAEDRPVVTVEVGDFDVAGVPTSAELLQSVMAHGYRPFEFDAGVIRPHALKDLYSYDNILLVPEEHALVGSDPHG